MINFFTIVLNGMPFIRYHIRVLQKLSVPWRWHIIEGVADLRHDTAWGVKDGARILNEFHNNGASVDGTVEYLYQLLQCYRDNIILYRKPSGKFWDGKIEMVNAPLVNIKEPCLLWQLDSDELWRKESIEKIYQMFSNNPSKTSAYFYCYYFLGPMKYIVSDNVKSTRPEDWLRIWRFKSGMKWNTHEPPVLINGTDRDIGRVNPFTREETLRKKITFQHFAYATIESVLFKQTYYGYGGGIEHWKKLQQQNGRVEIKNQFPWIWSGTVVDDWDEKVNGKLLWNT